MEILSNLKNSKLIKGKLNKSSNVKNDTLLIPKDGIIKGEVIDIKGLAVKILTEQGKVIAGKMEDAQILNMGDQKAFEVFQENGQTKMKTLNFSHKEVQSMQIKKALADLGIINSDLDEAIAQELIDNELPVNEKMLKDLGRLLKLFNAQSDNQINVNNKNNNLILNDESTKSNEILKKEINIKVNDSSNEKVISKVINTDNLVDKNIHNEIIDKNKNTLILKNNTLIDTNNDFDDNKLLASKNVDKGVFILKNEIPVNLKNSNLVTQFSKGEVNIQSELSNILENIKSHPNNELKQSLENIIKFSNVDGINEDNLFTKINIKNFEEVIKNEEVGSKILKLIENSPIVKEGETFTIDDLLNMSKDKLVKILKEIDTKELSKLIKNNVKDLDFSFKLNSGTLEEVDDFFKETTEKFQKIVQELQKRDDEPSKELLNKILDTKDKIEFGNHIKTNIFLQLPLNIKEHKTNGQLTIFKDKRKKGTKDVSSALISLDTKNLGTFETFIQKHNNNLNLQFRLENEEIEKLVKNNISGIKSTLSALRYNVDSITFKTIKQSFSILNTENDLNKLELNIKRENTTFEAKA